MWRMALAFLLGMAVSSDAQVVRFRLEATDVMGIPVSEVVFGNEFFIRVLGDDLSSPPDGIFSAYFDVTFDESIVTSRLT